MMIRLLAAAICVIAASAPAQPIANPYDWKNLAIGGGGFVTGIITHPRAKDVIYARTDVGGAYRFDAAAQRWVPITDWIRAEEWNFTGIESLAIDPSNPDRVYIACGTYTNEWSPNNSAIFRSDDRGATWRRTDMPFKMGGNEDGRSNGERLAVDSQNGDVVFFGSRNAGLWRSVNAGATWARVSGFPEVATSKSTMSGTNQWSRPVGIVFVFVGPAGSIYAGVSTNEQPSLHRSTDGGESWSAVPDQPIGLRPHHAALDADGSIYVTYGNLPGPSDVTDGAVWKLDSNSGAWTEITPIKPDDQDKFGYSGVTVDAQKRGVVMVSTIDRWTKKDDLFRTTDGGKTWKSIGAKATRDVTASPWVTWGRATAEVGHWIGDIEIDPFDSDHVVYVTGTGVWATREVTRADRDEPTCWFVASSGIEECVINEIVSPPRGASLLSVMWDIDGFRHEDVNISPPQGFFKPAFGHNRAIDFSESDPNFVVRVYEGGKTHGAYSIDNGRSWAEFPAAPAGRGGGHVAVSADGKAVVWSPQDAPPQVSHDCGKSWDACEGIGRAVRVVSDRVNASTFYAQDDGRFFASTDGGKSFTAGTASDLPKGEAFIRAVPGQSGHVWLASSEGLFVSVDAGSSFKRLAGLDSVRRIGFGKAASGQHYPVIYLTGKSAGVYGFYRSTDGGVSWARINDDLHQFGTINTITGDPRVFGRVYVGSANRGIIYGEPVER